MSIAEVLEERRVARGVSYAEIARRCSMNPDVVSRAFQGKGELKAGQFLNICRVLWTAQNMCRRGEVRCTKLNNRTWRIDAREYLERKVAEMNQVIE